MSYVSAMGFQYEHPISSLAAAAASPQVSPHNITSACQEHESEEPFLSLKDAKQRQELVKELHLLKTDIFMKMVESGMMPLRPGVQRLVGAAPFP